MNTHTLPETMIDDLWRGWKDPQTGIQPPRLGLDPKYVPTYGMWAVDYSGQDWVLGDSKAPRHMRKHK